MWKIKKIVGMMNKEDYVSLEVARLLKEKGYNIPCRTSRKKNGELIMYEIEQSVDNMTSIGNECYEFLCPTLYEAQKWLWKEKDIYISVLPHYSRKYEIIEYEYRIATYFDLLEKPCKWKKSKEYYEIYEQCLNNGILEALKIL